MGKYQCRFFIWEDHKLRTRSLIGSEHPIPTLYPQTPHTPGGRSYTPASAAPASTSTMSIQTLTPIPFRSYMWPAAYPHPGERHIIGRVDSNNPNDSQSYSSSKNVAIRGDSTSHNRSSNGYRDNPIPTPTSTSTGTVPPGFSLSDTLEAFEKDANDGNNDKNQDDYDEDDGEVDSVLFIKLIDLFNEEDFRLKEPTRIMLRSIANEEEESHETKLQRSERTKLYL
jgi:hypothetical protein